MEVTFRGPLPKSLNLGSWGEFSVRRLALEPLWCFKCHAFGHVQQYCRRHAVCSVCSGRQPSAGCLNTLRAGGCQMPQTVVEVTTPGSTRAALSG